MLGIDRQAAASSVDSPYLLGHPQDFAAFTPDGRLLARFAFKLGEENLGLNQKELRRAFAVLKNGGVGAGDPVEAKYAIELEGGSVIGAMAGRWPTRRRSWWIVHPVDCQA